jgi:phage baseplate assembly protein W
MADGYGPSLPITFGGEDGYAMHKTLIEEIKQNFKILLACNPGERIMLPNFGIGIKRYLFEQQSPTLYQKIKKRIEKQVQQYMPVIQILSIEFGGGGVDGTDSVAYGRGNVAIDSNILSIRIVYKITTLSHVDEIEVEQDSI